MIQVRELFQVKFGHMDELLAVLRTMTEWMTIETDGALRRVLTDASGQMFTLVLESEAQSIDAYMLTMAANFNDPRMAEMMAQLMAHVEHGRREFYNIEMRMGG